MIEGQQLFTFEGLRGSWCVVFIWMEFQSQLPVRFLKILLHCILFNTKDLVVIFTTLDPLSAQSS